MCPCKGRGRRACPGRDKDQPEGSGMLLDLFHIFTGDSTPASKWTSPPTTPEVPQSGLTMTIHHCPLLKPCSERTKRWLGPAWRREQGCFSVVPTPTSRMPSRIRPNITLLVSTHSMAGGTAAKTCLTFQGGSFHEDTLQGRS